MLNRRDVLRTGAALPALSRTKMPFARSLAADTLALDRFVLDRQSSAESR